MTYIGIDYGSKRVGVAFSDEGETVAFPYGVVNNSSRLIMDLEKIAEEKKSNSFVIGESKNYQGGENEIMKEIHELKDQLEKAGYSTFFEPEFMTSLQATHIQGENKMVDASAAAIILQSFLSKLH